jgi:hypothetical protein
MVSGTPPSPLAPPNWPAAPEWVPLSHGSLPPRSRSGRSAIVVVVSAGAMFLAVAAFVNFLGPPPWGNCTDWWVSCPGGPGNTPLGTAFEFGNATSTSVTARTVAEPGCRVPPSGEEFCENIHIASTGGGLGTDSIWFQLLDPAGTVVPFVSVTLLDAFGDGIASETPYESWTLCSPALCGGATSTVTTSLPAVLSTSDVFILDAGPSATYPGGLASFGLEAFGSGVFSGSVGPVLLA